MMHYSIQSVGIHLDIPKLRATRRRHSREIVESVARAFMVSVEDLTGPRSYRRLAWARQAAYRIIRKERKLSYPQIGQIFKRDHSTIVYGCRVAGERLETNVDFADAYRRAARG